MILRKLITLCALLVLATAAQAQRIDNVDQFVQSLGLGQNFYAISRRTAQRTTTYQALVAGIGLPQASALLEQSLRAAVAQRQQQWDANLLSAYQAHFSDEQLLSIANDGAQSPYAARFTDRRAAVSADMQAMSADLLLQTVSDGLARASAAAAP